MDIKTITPSSLKKTMLYEVCQGRFNSVEVKLLSGTPDETEFRTIVDREKEKQKLGAIFVFVPVHMLSFAINILSSYDFKFHRVETKDGVDTYVYYIWCNPDVEDKVQDHASGIAGVGVILLNPTKDKVLLVHEYGKYKAISGAVGKGEKVLDVAKREVFEEVGIQIDETFEPVYVGGWQVATARPGGINDNFICLAMCSTSEDIKVDGFEIQNAKWFDIKNLSDTVNNGIPSLSNRVPLYAESFEHEGERFSYVGVCWIRNYLNNSKHLKFINKENVTIIV